LSIGKTAPGALGRRAVAAASPDDRAAVQLYRGDFLEGDYDDWAVAERERLTTPYETVLGRAARTSRDPEAARLLIARNPYAEEAYVTLIETELESGQKHMGGGAGCRFSQRASRGRRSLNNRFVS
jgi:hypothetical protein